MCMGVSQAACQRTYVVGVSDLGYSAFYDGKTLRGIAPELVHELMRRSGCRLVLSFRPRARVMQEFAAGTLDIITSVQRTPERDLIGAFLPYAYTETDLATPAAYSGITSLAAFAERSGLQLGVVRGIYYGRHAGALIESLADAGRLQYSPDFQNLAAKLNGGRIQGALFPFTIHVKLMNDGVLDGGTVVTGIPEEEPASIGLYLKHGEVAPADVERLNKWLKALVREGWVERTYASYLGRAQARHLFRLAHQP